MMDSALTELRTQGILWNGPATTTTGDTTGSIRTAGDQKPAARFGITEIDSALPTDGLCFGRTHEWALDYQPVGKNCTGEINTAVGKHWYPPLSMIATFLCRQSQEQLGNYCIAWVGRKCWPTAQLIAQTLGSAENNLFIDPPNKEKRLWAIIQLLRCPAVSAVVADGSGLSLTAHRRLMLAAEKRERQQQQGSSVLALIMRPPWELQLPSPADTRWRVSPVVIPGVVSEGAISSAANFQWQLELVKAKGVAPSSRSWVVERSPAPELVQLDSLAVNSETIKHPSQQRSYDSENPLRLVAATASGQTTNSKSGGLEEQTRGQPKAGESGAGQPSSHASDRSEPAAQRILRVSVSGY